MLNLNEDIDRIKEVMYEMKVISKKRLVLNFPNLNNWEKVGSKIAKLFNLVTKRFKTIGQAEAWLDENHTLFDKPLETLIFGSHGRSYNKGRPFEDRNIMAVEGNEDSLIKTVKSKGLVGSNTLVFFTACHGGDKFIQLFKASQELGVPVYASKGTYNYVTNSSEGGFVKVDSKGKRLVDLVEKEFPTYYRDLVGGNKHTSVTKKNFDDHFHDTFAYNVGYIENINGSPISWL
jgi:hypothetical protein